jgi:FKBP-type peptidyl-prolyl cis-trans isomerase FkpA
VGCGGNDSTSPTPLPTAPFSSTDLVVGTGAEAVNGKRLTVNYTVWLYTDTTADHKGTQYQTTVGGTPFSFVLGTGQVIRGWEQGLVGMKVGGASSSFRRIWRMALPAMATFLPMRRSSSMSSC